MRVQFVWTKRIEVLKECTMQDGGISKKLMRAADKESFNALCKEGGRLFGVIAGAQVPRLKNETKQDATLTLRLS